MYVKQLEEARVTIVLVHGNPETEAVWGPLSNALVGAGHDAPVRLSPPGFGAPLPDGFDVTPEGYRAWLVGELEQIEGPVDLVGHDWGGIHVVNVAMTRPDLIRSWATDAIRAFHADYVWHALAQVWQKPDEGEAWIDRHLADGAVAELLTARGMAPEVTRAVAPRFDATMGACILRLYRASAQPEMARLGEQLEVAAKRPGLVFSPEHDLDATTAAQQREAAARAGAEVVELPGVRALVADGA